MESRGRGKTAGASGRAIDTSHESAAPHRWRHHRLSTGDGQFTNEEIDSIHGSQVIVTRLISVVNIEIKETGVNLGRRSL